MAKRQRRQCQRQTKVGGVVFDATGNFEGARTPWSAHYDQIKTHYRCAIIPCYSRCGESYVQIYGHVIVSIIISGCPYPCHSSCLAAAFVNALLKCLCLGCTNLNSPQPHLLSVTHSSSPMSQRSEHGALSVTEYDKAANFGCMLSSAQRQSPCSHHQSVH